MAKPNTVETCFSCTWYVPMPDDGADSGHCRAMPPIPVQSAVMGKPAILSVWPSVDSGDWCGEFTTAARYDKSVDALMDY